MELVGNASRRPRTTRRFMMRVTTEPVVEEAPAAGREFLERRRYPTVEVCSVRYVIAQPTRSAHCTAHARANATPRAAKRRLTAAAMR
jgi:hypothetical protein